MRTIVIDKVFKEEFTTLQNCCSKDEARQFLMNIYYNGKGTLVSTNGKWMFVYKMGESMLTSQLGEKEGYFTYTKDLLIEVEAPSTHFPQWERVVPKETAHTDKVSVETKIAKANRGAHLLANLVFVTGHRLSGDLHPVLKELTEDWEVGWNDEEYKPVILIRGTMELVIMPMATR